MRENKNLALCLIGILAATPLLCYPALWGSSENPKLLFLAFSVAILVLIWFFKNIAQNLPTSRPGELSFVKISGLGLILFFLLLLILSTLFSIKPSLSFYGFRHRYQGLITYLIIYFFLFLTAANFLASKEKQRFLIKWLSFSALLVSFVALLQRAGYTFGSWYLYWVGDPARAMSTFSNPNYFGAFLTLTIPLALISIPLASNQQETWLAVISLSSQLAALYSTFSRSAWLGLALSLAIIGLIFIFNLSREFKKQLFSNRSLAPLFLTVLLLCVTFTTLTSQANPAQPQNSAFAEASAGKYTALKRLHSFQEKERSFVERKLFWKAALKISRDHPLVGSGLETYQLLFPSYRPQAHLTLAGVPDRPHSDLLESFSTKGIPATLLYLAIFLAANLTCWSKVKQTRQLETGLFRLALIASLSGYFLQNQLNFHSIGGSYLFWTFLGISLAQPQLKPLKIAPTRRWRAFLSLLLILTLLLMAFFLTSIIKMVMADWFYKQAYNPLALTSSETRVNLLKSAVDIRPQTDDYLIALGELYLLDYEKTQNIKSAKEALYWLNKAAVQSPLNKVAQLSLLRLHLKMVEISGSSSSQGKALKIAQGLVKREPEAPENHFNLALTYLMAGEKELALFELNLAKKLGYDLDKVNSLKAKLE